MYIEDFKCSDKIVLPSKGETIAIAQEDKTAALCYDRIWSPCLGIIPETIRCFGGSTEELAFIRILSDYDLAAENFKSMLNSADTFEKQIEIFKKGLSPISLGPLFNFVFNTFNDYFRSLGFQNLSKMPKDQIEKVFDDVLKTKCNSKELEKFAKDNIGVFYNPLFRNISKSFYQKHRIPMIPIYKSVQERDIQYNEGNRKAIAIALSNIKIVDEDKLTWEQVLEFRKDKEIRRKYKLFLRWLNKDMIGKPQVFVEDEIAQKLEEYENALKKHSIKTVIGTVEETLDGKYLLGPLGIAASFTAAGHPILVLCRT